MDLFKMLFDIIKYAVIIFMVYYFFTILDRLIKLYNEKNKGKKTNSFKYKTHREGFDETKYEFSMIYDTNVCSCEQFSQEVELKIKEKEYNFKKEDLYDLARQYIIKFLHDGKIENIPEGIDKVKFDFFTIDKYYLDKENEYIDIIAKVAFLDFLDEDGNEKELKYFDKRILMKFKRKKDNFKQEKNGSISLTCSSCGGKLEFKDGKYACAYCGKYAIVSPVKWEFVSMDSNF